jgi:hypothetical protein
MLSSHVDSGTRHVLFAKIEINKWNGLCNGLGGLLLVSLLTIVNYCRSVREDYHL